MTSDSFNGLRFSGRFALPCFWTILAGICAGLGFAKEPAAHPFAVTFGFLAVVAWLRAPRGFTLRVDGDGLFHSGLNQRLPFAEIRGIRLSEHVVLDEKTVRRSRYLVIGFDGGGWRLPRSSACDRLAWYDFLLRQSRLLEMPPVLPGRLGSVVAEEEALFPGRVLASAGRPVLKYEVPNFVGAWLFCAAIVAGWLSCFAGSLPSEFATGFGIAALFTAFIAMVISVGLSIQRSKLGKIRSASGLVISPKGMTLEQPGLKGMLRWSEITRLQIHSRGGMALSGLIVGVDGGQFLLHDHFTCPLTEIHRLIKDYWSFEQR
jgi:hypothetical protein